MSCEGGCKFKQDDIVCTVCGEIPKDKLPGRSVDGTEERSKAFEASGVVCRCGGSLQMFVTGGTMSGDRREYLKCRSCKIELETWDGELVKAQQAISTLALLHDQILSPEAEADVVGNLMKAWLGQAKLICEHCGHDVDTKVLGDRAERKCGNCGACNGINRGSTWSHRPKGESEWRAPAKPTPEPGGSLCEEPYKIPEHKVREMARGAGQPGNGNGKWEKCEVCQNQWVQQTVSPKHCPVCAIAIVSNSMLSELQITEGLEALTMIHADPEREAVKALIDIVRAMTNKLDGIRKAVGPDCDVCNDTGEVSQSPAPGERSETFECGCRTETVRGEFKPGDSVIVKGEWMEPCEGRKNRLIIREPHPATVIELGKIDEVDAALVKYSQNPDTGEPKIDRLWWELDMLEHAKPKTCDKCTNGVLNDGDELCPDCNDLTESPNPENPKLGETEDILVHLKGWVFNALTYEILKCPNSWEGWKIEKYTIVSALGAGYVDNTLRVDMQMAKGSLSRGLTVDGIKSFKDKVIPTAMTPVEQVSVKVCPHCEEGMLKCLNCAGINPNCEECGGSGKVRCQVCNPEEYGEFLNKAGTAGEVMAQIEEQTPGTKAALRELVKQAAVEPGATMINEPTFTAEQLRLQTELEKLRKEGKDDTPEYAVTLKRWQEVANPGNPFFGGGMMGMGDHHQPTDKLSLPSVCSVKGCEGVVVEVRDVTTPQGPRKGEVYKVRLCEEHLHDLSNHPMEVKARGWSIEGHSTDSTDGTEQVFGISGLCGDYTLKVNGLPELMELFKVEMLDHFKILEKLEAYNWEQPNWETMLDVMCGKRHPQWVKVRATRSRDTNQETVMKHPETGMSWITDDEKRETVEVAAVYLKDHGLMLYDKLGPLVGVEVEDMTDEQQAMLIEEAAKHRGLSEVNWQDCEVCRGRWDTTKFEGEGCPMCTSEDKTMRGMATTQVETYARLTLGKEVEEIDDAMAEITELINEALDKREQLTTRRCTITELIRNMTVTEMDAATSASTRTDPEKLPPDMQMGNLTSECRRVAKKFGERGQDWDHEKLRQCWSCNSIVMNIEKRPSGRPPNIELEHRDWKCGSCGKWQNVPITEVEYEVWKAQLIVDGKDIALLMAGGSNYANPREFEPSSDEAIEQARQVLEKQTSECKQISDGLEITDGLVEKGQGQGWNIEVMRKCWSCDSPAVKISKRSCDNLPTNKEGYYWDWKCRSCGEYQNVPITKVEYKMWSNGSRAKGHERAGRHDEAARLRGKEVSDTLHPWDEQESETDWRKGLVVCLIIVAIIVAIVQCGVVQ